MREFNTAYNADSRLTPLYTPMRNAMGAMGKAMWHFAQLKEITWYCWGFAGITNAVHWLEHQYGEYIDSFKELLAQVGAPLRYPPIPEFLQNPQSLKEVFGACVFLLDDVDDALSEFIEAADTNGFEPLARQAETIQINSFKPRAWLLQAITMAEEGNSAATIDGWLKNTLEAPQQ